MVREYRSALCLLSATLRALGSAGIHDDSFDHLSNVVRFPIEKTRPPDFPEPNQGVAV